MTSVLCTGSMKAQIRGHALPHDVQQQHVKCNGKVEHRSMLPRLVLSWSRGVTASRARTSSVSTCVAMIRRCTLTMLPSGWGVEHASPCVKRDSIDATWELCGSQGVVSRFGLTGRVPMCRGRYRVRVSVNNVSQHKIPYANGINLAESKHNSRNMK